jgi:uncharacterized protein (DUF1499 family)
MKLYDPENLRLARTARTYPVETEKLLRTFEEAVQSLPQWTLVHAGGSEVRAVRKTRIFGFENGVTARLTAVGASGASMNTWAEFESVARVGVWNPGQNRRNVKELLAAIERQLRAENY